MRCEYCHKIIWPWQSSIKPKYQAHDISKGYPTGWHHASCFWPIVKRRQTYIKDLAEAVRDAKALEAAKHNAFMDSLTTGPPE